MGRTYGQVISGQAADGTELTSGVFNEHEVRAAAGITLVVGSVAFAYAYFDENYLPLQVVATYFFVEFLIRITLGLRYSPAGIAGRFLTRRYPADWVSAKPKRFAWTLGVALSLAMTVITNSGVRGLLPRTICLFCLLLMWCESALGICAGCEIHRFLVRRGWAKKDEAYEICAHGVCEIPAPAAPAREYATR